MGKSKTTRLFGAGLLGIMCVAAFGASSAAAATHHGTVKHKTKITKITACGYVINKAGYYLVTKNLTDTSNGSCIAIHADHVTLNLGSRTLTGNATDTAVYIGGLSSDMTLMDTVVGGTASKSGKIKPATITGFAYGVYLNFTNSAMISDLNIKSPATVGIYETFAAGLTVNNVDISIGSSGSASGYTGFYGAGNTITNTTVDMNNAATGFEAYQEMNDTFSHDVVKNSANPSGDGGTGFADYYGATDTFTHNTSTGHSNGFYFYMNGAGTVKALYNSASFPGMTGYGLYVYLAYEGAGSGSAPHSVISRNKTSGFAYGYYDTTTSSGNVAETWTKNVAHDYANTGFYFEYATDYTITGNTADGNTKKKHYDNASGTTFGFYFTKAGSSHPLHVFSGNRSYDNYWGYYSADLVINGKNNIARRDVNRGYSVQFS